MWPWEVEDEEEEEEEVESTLADRCFADSTSGKDGSVVTRR